MIKRCKITCLSLLFLFNVVFAFNHAEIKWHSVTTEHFIIHFYDRTEPAVYATWKIAEAAYESLSNQYDFSERGKISIALADYDDYSNGFANWTNESIMIWVTDARFDLRGNNTWLRNVITHELSHIVTLEKNSKPQLLDWVFAVSYQSPHSNVALTEPVPLNRFWPEWFAEGIAQRESQRAGNDAWDSRRDMVLRDAVMAGRPLSLDAMGHFNHNSVGDELVYNQGFSFITFLENRLSFQNLKQLYNDGRNTTLFSSGFASYFRDHTGLPIELLYTQWLDSLKAAYSRQIPTECTPLSVLWNKGSYNSAPKVSRDKRYIGWLSSDKDDYSRTDLLIAPYGAMDQARRIAWAQQAWDFSPDGKKVYYVKAHTPNEFGSYVNDIFAQDLDGGGDRRLIKNARAYDVAVSPDNKSLAWIQYRDGAFSLVRGDIDGRDPRTVIEGKIGEPLLYLSFNPSDPNELATTRIVGGVARLCVVDISAKTITQVTGACSQEETPFWADNGRIYYSADYTGISTIYSVNPDGSDCMQHARTSGGLFWPRLVDETTMLCTSYRNKGFSIASITSAPEEAFELPDSSASPFKPLPVPHGKVTIRSQPYAPTLLRPVWELQTQASIIDNYGKMETLQDNELSRNFGDSMSYDVSAALVMSQSDALEKQSKWMGLQGALIITGTGRDTSAHSKTHGTQACDPAAYERRLALFRHDVKTDLRRPEHFASNDAIASVIRPYSQYQSHSGAQDSSSDSTTKGSVAGVLIPGIGWQSSEHTLTFGLNAQGYIISAIIPAIINLTGEAKWHILRDLYAAFSPQFMFSPLSMFSGYFYSQSSWPLSLTWSATGYINTDIQYNLSDVTQVQAIVMPSFLPFTTKIRNQGNTKDSTVYKSGSSMTYALAAARGLPLTRYTSLVLSGQASAVRYSEAINDPLDTLTAAADVYTTFDVSAEYNFPIVRQISLGSPYADALYGSVVYEATAYTNAALIDREFSTALSVPAYDKNRYMVDHAVGASLKLGLTKSYAFSRMCLLKGMWDIWGKRLRITANFTF